MVTVLIVVAAALFFGYSKRYPRENIIGMGIAGVLGGFILFGVQVAFASEPRVPCWSDVKGVTQFFRAMPAVCQAAAPARR
jgi:hypothetical protein